MFKKKKHLIENLILKKGKKSKAENLLKETLKKIQKTNKKNSLPLIKNAIISSTIGFTTNKQTLKRGKRKKVVQTTAFLVSETARFSNSWKIVVKPSFEKKSGDFPKNLSKTIVNLLNKNQELKEKTKLIVNRKYGFKFRW